MGDGPAGSDGLRLEDLGEIDNQDLSIRGGHPGLLPMMNSTFSSPHASNHSLRSLPQTTQMVSKQSIANLLIDTHVLIIPDQCPSYAAVQPVDLPAVSPDLPAVFPDLPAVSLDP